MSRMRGWTETMRPDHSALFIFVVDIDAMTNISPEPVL